MLDLCVFITFSVTGFLRAVQISLPEYNPQLTIPEVVALCKGCFLRCFGWFLSILAFTWASCK